MTEKIQRVAMHAFRGVPGELTVELGKGESLAVYGDNGTGKSTIADALEWFFTGEIELLNHEGRQHAVRYVGGDDEDAATSVEVVTNGTLGGTVVFPDERNAETFQAMRRETFLLRGRTLADFINKTKTEKWKALVEILGLDAIESVREDLQRTRNDLRKESKASEEQAQSFRRALGTSGEAVTPESVLAELQRFCGLLNVDPPQSLDRVIEPSWLTEAVGASTATAEPSERETLLTELKSLNTPALDASLLERWNALVSSERARILPRASLVREASRLLDTQTIEGRCPVCGQSIDEKALARRIEKALADMMDVSRELEDLRDAMIERAETLRDAHDKRLSLHDRARATDLELPPLPAQSDTDLRACVDTLATADSQSITRYLAELRKWDRAVGKVDRGTSPSEPSTRDTQLVMLAGLCEHIKGWRLAEQKVARALRALTLADRVFEAYQAKQKEDLTELLKQISRRVAEIYARLHPHEDLAAVSIEPWTAKGVELAIEFHGSRQRPPHGVLSESHLNSLAIALFLAMAQEFNEHLGFLVLDDVINSFDIEHRGRLAELLADGFSDWQLIVLTHDQLFFEHLSRRAPSWRKLELTSWSHASGPRTTRYETAGILAAAHERLQSGDLHGAAAKARRGLEELLQELCEGLRAPLPFRRGQANDKREIGELFMGVRRTLKERAKALLGSMEPLLKNLEADVGATLNVEIHGSRQRAAASEVEATLKRIETLDRQWSCPECKTRVWHGNLEAGRCKCGKTPFPPARVG